VLSDIKTPESAWQPGRDAQSLDQLTFIGVRRIDAWGSNTFVLFYSTFATTFKYARVGKCENPSGLEAALGSGNVTLVFELQER
jgi:hypothetical protein